MLNWIVRNKTVLTFKLHTYASGDVSVEHTIIVFLAPLRWRLNAKGAILKKMDI